MDRLTGSGSLGSEPAHELARASLLTKRAKMLARLVTKRVELSRAGSRVSRFSSTPRHDVAKTIVKYESKHMFGWMPNFAIVFIAMLSRCIVHIHNLVRPNIFIIGSHTS